MALENIQPKEVFHFFEEICSIPHGSGNVKQISDYLVKFAKDRNLKVRQDEMLNVIIVKDATKGMESREPVIIQGHMDMVAVKTPDCKKDMLTEGLDLKVDGDFIYAQGTSLGGDDGIAVAYALALLDSEDIPHPKLEVVITVDEEVGMDGAIAVDLGDLEGKTLLNIDSEKEGELTVSCAGGVGITGDWKVEWTQAEEGKAYKLNLYDLAGGHSGTEIYKGRANANQVLFQLLYLLKREVDFGLICAKGGVKDNVICSSAQCVMKVRTEEKELVSLVKMMEETLKKQWKETDPQLKLSIERVPEMDSLKEVSTEDFFRLMSFFTQVPNGVQKMSEHLEGLVETSLNFGTMEMENEKNMKAAFSLRSSVEEDKEKLAKLIEEMIAQSEGDYTRTGAYPGWEYREVSPLREKMVKVYKKMFHKDPKVIAIHAGLECGLLSEKIENLDCISFGPDILNIHSTQEKLSISSVARMWDYIKEVLLEE